MIVYIYMGWGIHTLKSRVLAIEAIYQCSAFIHQLISIFFPFFLSEKLTVLFRIL